MLIFFQFSDKLEFASTIFSRLCCIWMILLSLFVCKLSAQNIPDDRILAITELEQFLKPETRVQFENSEEITSAQLAQYFREKFSQRFFYDHKSFYHRLKNYNALYENQASHERRALDHLNKYPDSTQWVLPFNYQNGKPVNAYALRHLARQHKMVDIALHYFQDGKNPKYINYFVNQMASLNAAFEAGQYEKIEDGNGVYEVYRSGYRIFNWIWIHNMFLNEAAYDDAAQLHTIATLLQHGQHLYERNSRFKSGNHQTKGMSALAVLSILLRDFEGTDKWYDRAMLRLSEHLDKEINDDGFQFERSVHYHMSDINNYFYVYQLARINEIQVDKDWENKLRTLFTTLTKIAYPDKSAPVLQDDTEIPWAEKNDISGAMTLGYLLFEDPEFGYFATNIVDDRVYWYLSNAQVENLVHINQKAPTYGSLAFEDTGYFVMREGWEANDKVMVISAGLDSLKPDHQHADMLGIQAIANGQIILPNYQVRYSLKDFEFFKNSMVKNVALVDDELQGKQWTSNKGGSGFGKFKALPDPKVIAWDSNDRFDLFVGSHNGFESNGVKYSRQVIYIKNAFWIVKDNFYSESEHDYKQVWQGHYTTELGPDLLRSTFDDASGCDILQFNKLDSFVTAGTRGKNWTVTTKFDERNFNFLTIVYPYQGYHNRLDENSKNLTVGDWKVNDSSWEIKGENPTVLSNKDEFMFFGVTEIMQGGSRLQLSEESDLYIRLNEADIEICLLGDKKIAFQQLDSSRTKKSILLQPGDHHTFKF